MTATKTISEATHEEIEAAAFAAIDALNDSELLNIDRRGAKIFFNPDDVQNVFFSFGPPTNRAFHESGIGYLGLDIDACPDEDYFQSPAEIRAGLKDMIDPLAIQAMAEEFQADED